VKLLLKLFLRHLNQQVIARAPPTPLFQDLGTKLRCVLTIKHIIKTWILLMAYFAVLHLNEVPSVDDHDDRARPPLIQQRGRFKVTPGHVELDKVLGNS
jgi:hypothetical protein